MVFNIVSALKDFSHLLFPHHCEGCGTDVVDTNQLLCIKCIQSLPETNFFNSPGNPVEKIFYGRTKIQHAGASFYFTKDSLLQHLLIQLKYRNNKEAGIALGKLTGLFLKDAERFSGIDALVPLPLNPKKEACVHYKRKTLCKKLSESYRTSILRNKTVNLYC